MNDQVIGKHLAALREKAGLKQNELAKQLEWSAAVLSRIESGERALADDELETILRGIGTPEAARLKEVMSREWSILPRPQLGDPDADLLWEAEQVGKRINDLARNPDLKQSFQRRLARYLDELSAAAKKVSEKHYRVSFIGMIAAGKSTAICRLSGLEVPSTKGMPKPVLETGAGGITICEVQLRQGPGYGLIIEPCSEDEVRHHVADFANFLLKPATVAEDEGGKGTPGLSREIERALRNMTGLRRRRSERKPDGTIIPATDMAQELAAQHQDPKSLIVALLSRMELHKRDCRSLWHPDSHEKPPLEWLQDLFERVNNGRHPEFTLPRRIELIVPTPVLSDSALAVTLIDTQGIDDIASRADLEKHFDDAHTAVILCSKFEEAPTIEVRKLLERAKDAGVRTLATNSAILVLPRPGEAMAMKDDSGYPPQSSQDGYQLKLDQMLVKLYQNGISDISISFFNAAEDAPDSLRSFIRTRLEAIRSSHSAALRQIINGANSIIAHYKKEQTREIIRIAAHRLTTWLDNHSTIEKPATRRVHESLLAATSSAHWKTVSASISRKGNWHNLNYSHELSHGARTAATQLIDPKLKAFKTIAQNLLEDTELAEAHDLINQTLRTLEDDFDAIIRAVQLVGESVYADDLSEDSEFWRACSDEWGNGYRDRINDHNRGWFEAKRDGEADERVYSLVKKKWNEAIGTIRSLIMQD
jgi:transcriptional regulator with XRE-family HTH domain